MQEAPGEQIECNRRELCGECGYLLCRGRGAEEFVRHAVEQMRAFVDVTGEEQLTVQSLLMKPRHQPGSPCGGDGSFQVLADTESGMNVTRSPSFTSTHAPTRVCRKSSSSLFTPTPMPDATTCANSPGSSRNGTSGPSVVHWTNSMWHRRPSRRVPCDGLNCCEDGI